MFSFPAILIRRRGARFFGVVLQLDDGVLSSGCKVCSTYNFHSLGYFCN